MLILKKLLSIAKDILIRGATEFVQSLFKNKTILQTILSKV
jgi:hypothetical protein